MMQRPLSYLKVGYLTASPANNAFAGLSLLHWALIPDDSRLQFG
jgi:hypothetical protein